MLARVVFGSSVRGYSQKPASCSVLQCVAVCSSVLQCVAVCSSMLQCVAVCCSVLQCDTAVCCCSVLQCVALVVVPCRLYVVEMRCKDAL